MPFLPPDTQPQIKIWRRHPDSPIFQGRHHSSARALPSVTSIYGAGHSLWGHHNSLMLAAMAEGNSEALDWNYSWGDGLPLRFHIESHKSTDPFNIWSRNMTADDMWDTQLASGYSDVVVTEAVDQTNGVQNHILYNDTFGHVATLYDAAIAGNPNCNFWVMETAMDQNKSEYPTLADWYTSVRGYHLNSWNSIRLDAVANGRDVKMIYVGQAFADLYNEVQAGNLTGISVFEDFFGDLIHPNDVGFYFNACVVYSYLYGKSPAGLVFSDIDNGSFGTYDAPSATLAAELQALAWTSYNTHKDLI